MNKTFLTLISLENSIKNWENISIVLLFIYIFLFPFFLKSKLPNIYMKCEGYFPIWILNTLLFCGIFFGFHYQIKVIEGSNIDDFFLVLLTLFIHLSSIFILIKSLKKYELSLVEKNIKEVKEHKSRIKKDKTNLEKRMVIIEKNLSQFDSIKISKPNEFKNNLIQNEKKIIEKGNTEHLHKFIKISSFLNDLFENLQSSKQDLKGWFSEFYGENGDLFKEKYFDKIKSEKIPLQNKGYDEIRYHSEQQLRIRKGTASLSDYPSKEFLEKTEKLSKGFVDVFRRETIQLSYLEAIANSMLVFLLDNKQFYLLEILEVFDKLGALDSSWQKRTSEKLDNIGSKLDLLITGINELNKSIDTLIDKNDDILQELKSIDVGISTSVALQSITAYQTFKINMNTKEK